MEWSEFARDLGRELAGLDRDTILIVRERTESRHYVQAMREPDRLYAEAVSNNFLDGPLLLTMADEEVMSEAGWQPPADPAGGGPRNWWTELPAHATAGDHARLADVMVTALRDVQGVRRPADLVYESFHRHGTGLIELLDFGIDVADPARVTDRRRTTEAEEYAPAAAPVHDQPDELELRLADAKNGGDHTTYFELLLSADLIHPAAETEQPTIVIGAGTYITVYTSPRTLARSGHPPGVRTTFSRLSATWPDPAWQLAVNPGLPSEIHLDVSAVARLDATERALAQAPEPPTPSVPVAATPRAVAASDVPAIASAVPIRPPHGTRLWRWDDTGVSAPAGTFDALSGAWTPTDG